MSAMCCVSRPLESPNPGQSITINGSPPGLPCHLTRTPATSSVTDYESASALNILTPQIELHVDDFPWPVTPIMIMTLNFEGSLPVMAANLKSGVRSAGMLIHFYNSSLVHLFLASVV
jgi:hypothetical protein